MRRSVAVAVTLALEEDPQHQVYGADKDMRRHLRNSILAGKISAFVQRIRESTVKIRRADAVKSSDVFCQYRRTSYNSIHDMPAMTEKQKERAGPKSLSP